MVDAAYAAGLLDPQRRTVIMQRPLGLGTHIFVADADAAVASYCAAFGGTELIRYNLRWAGLVRRACLRAPTS